MKTEFKQTPEWASRTIYTIFEWQREEGEREKEKKYGVKKGMRNTESKERKGEEIETEEREEKCNQNNYTHP